jgi:hypothetical protein
LQIEHFFKRVSISLIIEKSIKIVFEIEKQLSMIFFIKFGDVKEASKINVNDTLTLSIFSKKVSESLINNGDITICCLCIDDTMMHGISSYYVMSIL